MGTFNFLVIAILIVFIPVKNWQYRIEKHPKYRVGWVDVECPQVVGEGDSLSNNFLSVRRCDGKGGAFEGGDFLKMLFLWKDKDVLWSRSYFEQCILNLVHFLSGENVHGYKLKLLNKIIHQMIMKFYLSLASLFCQSFSSTHVLYHKHKIIFITSRDAS